MLPKQLPVKTECKTFRYRSRKAATPGAKEDACCQKKDVHEEENTWRNFEVPQLQIIQHNCSTYLLHHHKPTTAEESRPPFVSRCAMSFEPSVQGTETSSHQRWVPRKRQCQIRYVSPMRLINHHSMFLEEERHLIARPTRFSCPEGGCAHPVDLLLVSRCCL